MCCREGRLVKLPEVLHLCGISRSTMNRWIKSGHFPPPVQIGPRAVAWRESDIREWLESRPVAATVVYHSK